jgi:hypothetical protein
MIEVLTKIRQAGGTIEVVGGDLRLRLPKGLLTPAERSLLAEHKADLCRLLADDQVVETPVVVGGDQHEDQHLDGGLDQDQTEEPIPCSTCGGLLAWWDLTGGRHCMSCDGEMWERSERFRATAARLRRQAPPFQGTPSNHSL